MSEKEVLSRGSVSSSPNEADIRTIRRAATLQSRIGFVSGVFNILHPGHMRILKFAKENCDFLAVGITLDSSGSIPAHIRLESLNAISFVDYAFTIQTELTAIIENLRPDIVVKGKEFENSLNIEQKTIESYGGRLLFSSGGMEFSPGEFIEELRPEPSSLTASASSDYLKRHNFTKTIVRDGLKGMNSVRAMVIGDLILDRYVDCIPLGMSQEDPTIVITPIEEKTFVGGAGVVAAHAKGLGGDVRFVTITGDDELADFAQSQLADNEVDLHAFTDQTRPTTLKERYRASGQSMIRINHLRQHAIDQVIQAQILDCVREHIKNTDVILFSDFNYGCLTQQLVDAITVIAKSHGVMMFADSQASSQLSDISRFREMTAITPTEHEARLALRDMESGIVAIAEKLKQISKASNVVVTLGAEGLLAFGEKDGTAYTDQLPAFNSAPKDVAGAGDSLFACMSLAICSGMDIWKAVYLGTLTAAFQVSRLGNSPITHSDLLRELEKA